MNEVNGGLCNTKGMRDYGKYQVPADLLGRSPLTGGSNYEYSDKRFTCVELEVFALE